MASTEDRSPTQELEAGENTPDTSPLAPDTRVEPRKVSAIILRIHALVKKLLPVEVSEDSLKSPDGLLNASVIASFVKAGGDFTDVVPFALLEAKKLFQQ
jgi:hypothetical protein